jgi:hypothetical protein
MLVNDVVWEMKHANGGTQTPVPCIALQVMKMVMTLTASEAGSVFYVKRPGAVLDAGSLIAHLELDDASLVTKAQEYKGQFPELEVSTPVVGEKLNHVHSSYRVMLENILSGGFFFMKIVQRQLHNDWRWNEKWIILICYIIPICNTFSETLIL